MLVRQPRYTLFPLYTLFRSREEIMNNNTAMVDSQQLQLHQQQQLHELQKTAINAQGIDCDDLQHFTTNLQITNTINDFSF